MEPIPTVSQNPRNEPAVVPRPHRERIPAGIVDDDEIAFFDGGQDQVLCENIPGKAEWSCQVPRLGAAPGFKVAVAVKDRILVLPVLRVETLPHKQVGSGMDHGGADARIVFDILHPACRPARIGIHPPAEFSDE